ncbi:hypothetical protein LIER_00659 [Lithospermum erythrorhizon]|uniref:Uncharacterized protein n=1 Tax=Lithospermum erythrorhizon TaxID=34254 RepID=A0AAV3NJ90_LITER
MHKESHKNISQDRMFYLNLNVVFESHTTNVTLFGEVPDVLAGCSVKEYIDCFEKDPINSQKYEQLGKSVWKEYKFLFKLDKSNVKGDKFSTIVEAVELLTNEYPIDDNNTKTMVDVKSKKNGAKEVAKIEKKDPQATKNKRGRPKKVNLQASRESSKYVDVVKDDDDRTTLLDIMKTKKIKQEKKMSN